MHRFIEILKSHPYAIGGGVLIGAFLIYMMSRSGSASGGTYAQPQNSEAELASINAQLVSSQDAIRMQGNLGALALQAKQSDNATSLAIAQNASATALAINDNATALNYQQEQDKSNLSLLTLSASTALTSQQQGYTAELASQKEADTLNEMNRQDAYYTNRFGMSVDANLGYPVTGQLNNWLKNIIGGGGSGTSSGANPNNVPDFVSGSSYEQTQVASQATAAAAVSNAALAAMYSATAHLTAPASNSPTAPAIST